MFVCDLAKICDEHQALQPRCAVRSQIPAAVVYSKRNATVHEIQRIGRHWSRSQDRAVLHKKLIRGQVEIAVLPTRQAQILWANARFVVTEPVQNGEVALLTDLIADRGAFANSSNFLITMFLLYPVRCLVGSLRDLRALEPCLIGSPHHPFADSLSS